ncbi:MAG: GHKL domain-containing protein [Alphaproteobacteria bacterium]|nr:GHKL domain-containing protein [Alphaproteobacteria bacterium]MBQ6849541.1 GHKL domain-containing protein [Oscillospiraceae bacterium]
MRNVITIFFSIIEIISTIFICNAFLKEKKYRHRFLLPTIATVIVIFLLLWSFQIVKENLLLKIIIVFVLYLCMINFLYDGKLAAKFTLLIIVYVLFYTVDILAVGITMLVFAIDYITIVSFNNLNILVSMLSKLISLSTSIIVNKINTRSKRELSISTYEWVQLLLYPAVTFLILLVFIESVLSKNEISVLMLLAQMAIILADIVIFLVINRLDNEKRIREENTILQQKIKVEMKNVEALMDAYDEQRKMTHDFNNHLSIIGALVEQNEISRLNTYIDHLGRNLKNNILPVKTNNLIIDAILNQKYNNAVKNNIIMEFYINDLSNFPMKDEDIVIVLTNALDNAIEACMKLNDEKIIRVKITNSKSESIISIKNRFDYNDFAGQLLKRNTESFEHGFGLRNIAVTLEKYGARLVTKYDDKWFQMSTRIVKQ